MSRSATTRMVPGYQLPTSNPASQAKSQSDGCPRNRTNYRKSGLRSCGRTPVQMTDAGSVPFSTTTTPNPTHSRLVFFRPQRQPWRGSAVWSVEQLFCKTPRFSNFPAVFLLYSPFFCCAFNRRGPCLAWVCGGWVRIGNWVAGRNRESTAVWIVATL